MSWVPQHCNPEKGVQGQRDDANFVCVPKEALMFFPVLPPASHSWLPGLFSVVPANLCTFLGT